MAGARAGPKRRLRLQTKPSSGWLRMAPTSKPCFAVRIPGIMKKLNKKYRASLKNNINWAPHKPSDLFSYLHFKSVYVLNIYIYIYIYNTYTVYSTSTHSLITPYHSLIHSNFLYSPLINNCNNVAYHI